MKPEECVNFKMFAISWPSKATEKLTTREDDTQLQQKSECFKSLTDLRQETPTADKKFQATSHATSHEAVV